MRHQDRLEEAKRRKQRKRHVQRPTTQHGTPTDLRWAIYGILTLGTTLVVWRLTHWVVWASSGVDPSTGLSRQVESSPDPGAWVDPVGLLLGLALGVGFSWFYASCLEGW